MNYGVFALNKQLNIAQFYTCSTSPKLLHSQNEVIKQFLCSKTITSERCFNKRCFMIHVVSQVPKLYSALVLYQIMQLDKSVLIIGVTSLVFIDKIEINSSYSPIYCSPMVCSHILSCFHLLNVILTIFCTLFR